MNYYKLIIKYRVELFIMINKNIGFVLTSLRSGGLERNAISLANHFIEKGNNVFIYCLYSTECFFDVNKNVNIIDCTSSTNKIFSIHYWIKKLSIFFEKDKIDTIISFGDRCGVIASRANRKRMANHICRGVNTKRFILINNFLLVLSKKYLSNFVFQTNAQKHNYFSCLRKKGVIIPNPFVLQSDNLNEFGLNSKRFVSVATFKLKQKRQDFMIRSFALFHKLHKDYKLDLYGKYDNKSFKKINRLIKKNSLENFVNIKGEIKDVKNSILNSRGFLCTSKYEGMPNALIEALSYGIPVLTTKWNGCDEIIKDGLNGLIIDDFNKKEFAKKMALLADNNDLFSKISNNCYKKIICDFKSDKVFAEWDRLI